MSKQDSDSQSYNVVIAGGGMVGSALGCALGQQGFRVAVIQLHEPDTDWMQDEVHLRVSALSRASQCFLENLDVWERMSRMRISPYREMHVWDATGNGSIHFHAADIGEPDLGHIVENRVTQLALWEKLGELDTVTKLCPERIEYLEARGTHQQLHLAGGAAIIADLVVAAEGANSPLRKMAGISSSGWSYDQHAIVATIWPDRHHGEVARQRFMPSGPLALLPIYNGRCSIVWSTSPFEAQRLMALDDELFCTELTEASGWVLGTVNSVGPRAKFPLYLRNADRYIQSGLALVGDAAHGIHPLAGQGVNLGFLDIATLTDILQAARKTGHALGAFSTLRRYERARKGADMIMLGVMDLFKRLFSNDNTPLSLIRNLGLNLADASGPIKHLIMRRAMGLTGELPTLTRTIFK